MACILRKKVKQYESFSIMGLNAVCTHCQQLHEFSVDIPP